jgi:hypothetical protein
VDTLGLVKAGGGREPPRDAAATAICRGKLPDIPGERSLPGSLPQGRDDPIRKALFPEFSYDNFELTNLWKINQEFWPWLKATGREYAEHFTEAKTSPAALYLVADP